MLARLAELPAARRAAAPPPAGVLYKGPKPGQDRRLDLPAVGPATAHAAAAAGLAGIAVEAGGTMILGYAETVAAADAAGLFLWGREP
jgi:UDP-2,3-diacylglucosamine hydrolase